MEIIGSLLGLGGAIAKSIIKMWIGDDKFIEPTSDKIIDLFTSNSVELMNARILSRSFEDIGDKIAENFDGIFKEYDIEEVSKTAIIDEVSRTLNNYKITHKLLLEISNNPKKLYDVLLKSNQKYKKYFGKKEEELYLRCLDLSTQYIIDIAPQLPNYTKENFHEIIRRFDDISKKIDLLLEEIKLIAVSSNVKSEQNFERDYRSAIIRKHNKITLFGANIDRSMRKYNLSVAYVDLEVSRCDEDIDEEYEYRISISEVFDYSNIILIIGEAGSGKTTLLQWLAVKSASGEIEEKIQSLYNSIPFVIELRKIKEWPIDLEQHIGTLMKDVVVSKIPENWVRNVLESGNALLLIDGFDEISKKQRENVLNWIEELVDTYEDIKVIITSRPSAKEKLINDYTEIEILPMSKNNISKFIDYWHNAVLIEQGLETKEESEIIKNNLIEKIYYNEPVNKLASNPLLCAMLCALHYKNNLTLPSDRNELYEECCKMLLDSRDNARNIKTCDIGELNYREKRAILDELAYWMIRNGKVSIDIELVKERIYRKALNMNIIKCESDIETLVRYFIERSGLIREPENGVIDFIHKTFQEYMAAKEASNQGDWGLLVENAEKDSWYETILLAISFANKKNADLVIEGLLDKARKYDLNSTRYNLISMACTESAIEISKEIRERVKKITQELIPPKLEQCKEIALSGSLVIPYLSDKENYTEIEKKACIRVLRIINSTNTLPMVGTYINANMSMDVEIEIERLLSIANRRDISRCELGDIIIKYILELINGVSLEVNCIFLTSISEVLDVEIKLEKLKNIENLGIKNFNGEIPLYMPFNKNLRNLRIQGNYNNVSFLKKMIKLENLSITTNSKEFDIYELAKYKNLKTLKKLSIFICDNSYITFNKFENLKSIRELNIYLESNNVEIMFYGLNEYKNLKKLKLSSRYVLDLDLTDLNSINNLECLEIDVTNELLFGIVSYLGEFENLRRLILNFYNNDVEFNSIVNADSINNLKLLLPDCEVIIKIKKIEIYEDV